MNRRNLIRGFVASAAIPALPALSAAKDADIVKREAFRALLALSDEESHKITLLRIAAVEGHRYRAQTLSMFESGMPMDEVMQRVDDRVSYNCYGPKGRPVYDEDGMQIGGGSFDWLESSGGAA